MHKYSSVPSFDLFTDILFAGLKFGFPTLPIEKWFFVQIIVKGLTVNMFITRDLKTNAMFNIKSLFQYIYYILQQKNPFACGSWKQVFQDIPWWPKVTPAGWKYLWKSLEVEGVVDPRLRSWTHPPPPTDADLPESLKLLPL